MWSLPPDPRKTGLKYPHHNTTITPSGHKIVMDDSEGAESLTIEHRSGALLQFQPDGAIVFMSKTGMYQAVFGDSNILVTGSQSITVNGGASVKVEGDYDVTVSGNMKQTIAGNMEVAVAGDSTSMVAGKSETVVGGDASSKVAGDSEILAGRMIMAAESDIRVAGQEVSVVSDGNIDLAGDNVEVASEGLTHNGTNVGDTHTHLGVMAGSDETDIPT